jgi:23S rRNA (guanosine2251-2'-O)-methyltransferase
MKNDGDRKLIWGYHPVFEALQARRRNIRMLYVDQDKRIPRYQQLIKAADAAGVSCNHTSARQMTAMIDHDRHQGVVAKVSDYPFSSVEEILAMPAAGGRPYFILMLDQVVDPQNFGAIARSAYCTGVQGIILPKNRSAPPSPAAVMASAGALEHLRVAYVTNLVNTIKILKKNGIWIVGAERVGATDLFESDLSMSLALVIGGEEKGIRPLVKQQCDFLVAIPQVGVLNSLNASAAAAVMLYEAFRQNQAKASTA